MVLMRDYDADWDDDDMRWPAKDRTDICAAVLLAVSLTLLVVAGFLLMGA